MKPKADFITSPESQKINEDGVSLQVDIYKRKDGDRWTLEVITEDGTAIVWDTTFEDDRLALTEALSSIRKQGAAAFAKGA